jgi:hypothetical protein
MQPIHFDAKITEAVYTRAQTRHYLQQPGVLVVPLVIIAAAVWNVLSAPTDLTVKVISSLITVALLLGLLWWLVLHGFRTSYRKLEEMCREMKGTVSDDGFRYASPDGTLTFPWANLKRAIVFDRGFGLVYRTEGYFLFLDRRFLASEEEWREVVGAVTAHLPIKARRRARSLIQSLPQPV